MIFNGERLIDSVLFSVRIYDESLPDSRDTAAPAASASSASSAAASHTSVVVRSGWRVEAVEMTSGAASAVRLPWTRVVLLKAVACFVIDVPLPVHARSFG